MMRLLRLFFLLLLFSFLIDAGLTLRQERPYPPLPPVHDGTVAVHDGTVAVHDGTVAVHDGLYRYAGAIHVHSRYSDGGGTVEEIARAAHRAGLDFVILSDHGTVKALIHGEQGYRDGVLVLVGEEVNTSAGHLLALGAGRRLEQQGPYGLPALIDTLHAAGGLAIPAHPYGRRPWTDWSLQAIDGLEVLNADSEWRNDSPFELVRALLGYPLFPEAALNSLMDRPDSALARWDALAQRRHTTGIGSVDAHARIPLWGDHLLRFPSYALMFRLIKTYVIAERPLTGAAGTDQAAILSAIRDGRCYIAVDGYEPATRFAFGIEEGRHAVRMGGQGAYHAGEVLQVRVGSSGGVLIRVVRNGVRVAETRTEEMAYPVTAPGVYRVEVYQRRPGLLSGERLRPWIFSNPIRLRPSEGMRQAG